MFEKLKQRRLEKEHDANIMLCLENAEWVPKTLVDFVDKKKHSWDYWLRCNKCGKCLGVVKTEIGSGKLYFDGASYYGNGRWVVWNPVHRLMDVPKEALDKFQEMLLEKFPDANEATPERMEYLEQLQEQFRRTAEGSRRIEEQRRKALEALPHCPNCHSVKIQPIKMTKRVIDTQLFGLASDTIGKTYECLDCKYKW